MTFLLLAGGILSTAYALRTLYRCARAIPEIRRARAERRELA